MEPGHSCMFIILASSMVPYLTTAAFSFNLQQSNNNFLSRLNQLLISKYDLLCFGGCVVCPHVNEHFDWGFEADKTDRASVVSFLFVGRLDVFGERRLQKVLGRAV